MACSDLKVAQSVISPVVSIDNVFGSFHLPQTLMLISSYFCR